MTKTYRIADSTLDRSEVRGKFLQTFRFMLKHQRPTQTLGLNTNRGWAPTSAQKVGIRAFAASSVKDLFGHPFHLLNVSPLPILLGSAFFIGAVHLLCVLKIGALFPFLHGLWLFVLAAIVLVWVFEAYGEERSGAHTVEVQEGFRIGIVLFIASEFMLFVSYFWGYFHVSLNSSVWIGNSWAPEGIDAFFWWRVPLLNTLLLLSSGLSLTIAHYWLVVVDRFRSGQLWGFRMSTATEGADVPLARFLVEIASPKLILTRIIGFFVMQRKSICVTSLKNTKLASRSALHHSTVYFKSVGRTFFSPSRAGGFAAIWVADTVIRGFAFLLFQVFEYIASFFTIADSAYGSLFFSLTGLHGFHVFVGVVFLAMFVFNAGMTSWTRYASKYTTNRLSGITNELHNTFHHRVAFDGSVWYWHFVDVVWLFVLLFIYWWGTNINSI